MNHLNRPKQMMKKNVILLVAIGEAAVFFPFQSNAVSSDFLSGAGFIEYKNKKRAPDFKLKDPDDNPASLEDVQGKIVLIYFWTTW